MPHLKPLIRKGNVLWWCMGKSLWCLVPLSVGLNPGRVVSFNMVILHLFYLVNNQLYNVPIIESIFGGSVPIIRPLSSRYLETRSRLFTQYSNIRLDYFEIFGQ